MRLSLKHIFPRAFFHNPAYFRAVGLATVYVTLVVSQLFTFEKFVEITEAYQIAGGEATAVLLAGVIPLLEVIALPFLLSMDIPARLRMVSRLAVVASPSLWLLIALWLNVVGRGTVVTGLMGATIPVINGWWFVVFAGLFLWAAVLVLRELPKRTHS